MGDACSQMLGTAILNERSGGGAVPTMRESFFCLQCDIAQRKTTVDLGEI